MRSTSKSKLNCFNWLGKMWSMTKSNQNNDMIDHTGVIYAKYDIELLRLIEQFAVYDEDVIRQRLDRSYMSTLRKKWNWIVVTDSKGYGLWWISNMTMMWLIVQVQYTPKLELNSYFQLHKMRPILKTRRDNDKGAIFLKYDIVLSKPIR